MSKQKIFYEKVNNDYIEVYKRVSRWIKIDFTLKGVPFFRHNNRRYKLDDFLRINYPYYDSEVITDTINAKDAKEVIQLSGYEANEYYKPLFIEISDSGDGVRLYQFDGMIN